MGERAPQTQSDIVIDRLIQYGGMGRMSELVGDGVHQPTLRRMCASGAVINPSKGVYALPDLADDPFLPVAAELVKYTDAVACLASAAWVHGLLVRPPSEVWLSRGPGEWAPQAQAPEGGHGLPVRILRSSFHGSHVSPCRLGGRTVLVTGQARTVVDLYRTGRSGRCPADLADEALGTAMDKGLSLGEIAEVAGDMGCWEEVEQFVRGASAAYGRRF